MTIQRRQSPPSTILCNSDHVLLTWLPLFLLLLHILPPATAQLPNTFSPSPSHPLPGVKISKSMAIIMVIIIVVFFVLGFLSVYTRQCAERRIRGRFELTIPTGGSGCPLRGLAPEVIDTFPTFVYSTVKGLKIGRSTLECAVCLSEFQDDETLRLIPKCNHVFHPICIDIWLTSHSTCPVCRANLVPTPGDVSIVAIQIPDLVAEARDPEQRTDLEENQNREATSVDDNRSRVVECPKVSLLNRSRTTNHNGPPRSRSTGFRIGIGNLFPRSHTTGHSLVQPRENHERFTLRLPEEVRNQLLNPTLNRTKSCSTFTRMSSERRGYRTRSVGSGLGGSGRSHSQYDRFGGEGRSGLRIFSRSGSARSGKGWTTESGKGAEGGSGVAILDNVGERSSDRLCGSRSEV